MESFTALFNDYGISLVFAFFLVLIFFYPRIKLRLNKNVASITAEEAAELIRTNKNLVIIDVRSPGEFASGHIQGAKNIPLTEMPRKTKALDKFQGKPLLVHCQSGSRSARAIPIMLKHNLGPIYHMNRGLAGWSFGLKK